MCKWIFSVKHHVPSGSMEEAGFMTSDKHDKLIVFWVICALARRYNLTERLVCAGPLDGEGLLLKS